MRVKISLTAHQQIDGTHETHAVTAFGHLSGEEGRWVLSYAERDEEGGERFTTLRLIDGEAQMEREAPHRSLLLMQPGRRCVCEYGTPYGALSVGVYTHAVHDRLTADGGSLELRYTLDFGGEPIEHILLIDVEKLPNDKEQPA